MTVVTVLVITLMLVMPVVLVSHDAHQGFVAW